MTWVELCDVETSYWSAADWSGLAAPEQAEIKILPFTYEEPQRATAAGYGSHCRYQVYVDGNLFFVPPTYLLEDGSKVRGTEPFGGHLMDQFGETAEYWSDPGVGGSFEDAIDGNNWVPMPPPAGTKPYPIYLGDPQAPAISDLIDRLLAAGVKSSITSVDYCDALTYITWSDS